MDYQIRLNKGKDVKSTEQHNTAPLAGPSELHPKLVESLSPSSGLYGVLWPIIIREGSWDVRLRTLRTVNSFFRDLCYSYRRSDCAQSLYRDHFGNVNQRPGLPYVLDLSPDADWLCWGADKAGFCSSDSFRKFCAIGDVDPDAVMKWIPWLEYVSSSGFQDMSSFTRYIWISRAKDVVFETLSNPLEQGYCHYFGLHGSAKKAKDMYQYMYDGAHQGTNAHYEIGWFRDWI